MFPNMWSDVNNTYIAYILAHALVLKTLSECMPHSPQKSTYTRTSTPVQRCSQFFSMQTIAIHFETWVLPKKLIPSQPGSWRGHGSLLHRHHLIIHVGAGSIQPANGSPSMFTTNAIRSLAGVFLFTERTLWSGTLKIFAAHFFLGCTNQNDSSKSDWYDAYSRFITSKK